MHRASTMKSGLSLVDQCLNVRLGLNLVVFRHGYDHIGNVIKVGNCLIVGMIGGDLRDQTGKFAALMTIKQIDQAVVVVRNGAPTEPGATSCRTHPPQAKNVY